MITISFDNNAYKLKVKLIKENKTSKERLKRLFER